MSHLNFDPFQFQNNRDKSFFEQCHEFSQIQVSPKTQNRNGFVSSNFVHPPTLNNVIAERYQYPTLAEEREKLKNLSKAVSSNASYRQTNIPTHTSSKDSSILHPIIGRDLYHQLMRPQTPYTNPNPQGTSIQPSSAQPINFHNINMAQSCHPPEDDSFLPNRLKFLATSSIPEEKELYLRIINIRDRVINSHAQPHKRTLVCALLKITPLSDSELATIFITTNRTIISLISKIKNDYAIDTIGNKKSLDYFYVIKNHTYDPKRLETAQQDAFRYKNFR